MLEKLIINKQRDLDNIDQFEIYMDVIEWNLEIKRFLNNLKKQLLPII